MSRWLLAAVVSSALLPAAALLFHSHWALSSEDDRYRAALADIVVDAPESEDHLIDDYGPIMDALRAPREIESASPLVTGPVLIGKADRRLPARLVGIDPASPRLVLLGELATVGSLEGIPDNREVIALGEGLARELGVTVGETLTVLALAPGPAALGARRLELRVAALLRADLTGFDGGTVITRLATARDLFGPGAAISGVEALLSSNAPSRGLEKTPPRIADRGLRTRLSRMRDWPDEDWAGQVGLARSTLFPAVVVIFMAFAAASRQKARSLVSFLRKSLPNAAIALAASLAAAYSVASIASGEVGSMDGPLLGDLLRLSVATAVGVVLAAALAGRLKGSVAPLCLAGLVAVATTQPATASVLASLTRESSAAAARAAESTASLLSTAPLNAAVVRGSEVAMVKLSGIDPSRGEAPKLLKALTGRSDVRLRIDGQERPSPWGPGGAALDTLLDELATHGTSGIASAPEEEVVDEPSPRNAKQGGPKPGIVLGHATARRLGAEPGDTVVVAEPPALELESGMEPPPPVAFEVVALAKVGLRAVDDSFTLVDEWQAAALGASTAERGDVPVPEGRLDRARGTFASRAHQAAAASALQIFLVCLLIGAVAASSWRGRKAAWVLPLSAAMGLALGLVMGLTDAIRGALEVGDAILYEAAPRGSASLMLALSPWSILPAASGLAASFLGMATAKRLGLADSGQEEGIEGESRSA